MERNYGAEIDELKKELQKLGEQLSEVLCKKWRVPDPNAPAEKAGHVQKMPHMHPDPSVMAIMENLENACGSGKASGCITYMGVFASGGRQSGRVAMERAAMSGRWMTGSKRALRRSTGA